MNIGVFDSGLGGLTVFKELLKKLPDYNYLYLGDNARVPYGGKSEKIIYTYIREAVDFLFKKNCLLVILACNTATAVALRKIQREYLPKKYPDKKVLGVIRPTVESVIDAGYKKIGVIGTYALVISKSFVKEIKKFDKSVEVYQKACPLLVPIIEEGEIDWQGLDMILKKYLQPLKNNNIDSLILGCTHYGLIDDKIHKIIGTGVHIVTEGNVTALKLKDYLIRHPEIEKHLGKDRQREYYVTDLNIRYKKMIQLFLEKYFDKKDSLRLASV